MKQLSKPFSSPVYPTYITKVFSMLFVSFTTNSFHRKKALNFYNMGSAGAIEINDTILSLFSQLKAEIEGVKKTFQR
jgi:hypothetical protein